MLLQSQLQTGGSALNSFLAFSLQGVLDRRSAARVKLLEGKLRKQVGRGQGFGQQSGGQGRLGGR